MIRFWEAKRLIEARFPSLWHARLRLSPWRARLRRKKASEKLTGFLEKHSYIPNIPAQRAIPPPDLIATTSLMWPEDISTKAIPDVYLAGGLFEALAVMEAAELANIPLSSLGSVFELGCGTARVLRHLSVLNHSKLVGSDLRRETVEWCRSNLPDIEFHQNDLEPPLKFAEDNQFDAAYAYSVFTHIPLCLQDKWIAEISRILKPKALFCCTVIGDHHASIMLDLASLERLRDKGHVELGYQSPMASYSTKITESWDVFQTEAEVRKAFSTCFDIVEYRKSNRALDLLIMRNKG